MKRFTLSAAMIALMLMGFSSDVLAGDLFHGSFGSLGSSSGSYGSSGGSYGSSGGSYGSSGGSYASSGGSYGSSGGSYGSSGGSSGGISHRTERLIERAARRSASSGSSGSSGGSSGGSYGSTGSSGGSYGSHGSSGGSSGTVPARLERKIYRSASHGSSGSHGSSSHGGSYGGSHGGSYGATSIYNGASASYAASVPSVSVYQQQYAATPVAPSLIAERPAPQSFVNPAAAQRTFTAAATATAAGYAYVVVQLPEDATLYLGGNATHLAGGLRKFKIPVTDPTKSYSYAIRAELTRNGRVYVATSTEMLVAGKTVSVKVNDVAANVDVAAR